MGAAIEQELGLTCEYVPGSGGIFEVSLDGELVYTNNNVGGVPEATPVIEAVRAAL